MRYRSCSSKLIVEGKIGGSGLSEAAPATIRRAHTVHPVTAVRTVISLGSRDPEAEIYATVPELGITVLRHSPLGQRFRTGTIRLLDHPDDTDSRRANPRLTGDNREANTRIVEQVDAVAWEVDATPGQVVPAGRLVQATITCRSRAPSASAARKTTWEPMARNSHRHSRPPSETSRLPRVITLRTRRRCTGSDAAVC